MTKELAPYRADHVGSLLRPAHLADARAKYFQKGEISAEELAEIEDAAIAEVVVRQENVGLRAITDGEYRRSFWHYDFLGMLDGLDLVERDRGISFQGAELRPVFPVINEKLGFPDEHPMLDHFRFVADRANEQPKISIPGPSCCHFRVAPEDIGPEEYKDLDALFLDIAETYRKAVLAFYEAGCRYLQMDDIFFAYLCDSRHRREREEIGQDPDWLIDRYAWMMRESIKDRPDDMVVGMHMCRGNFKSTYAAEGSYDPVADAVFNKTGIDIFFMEYDTERAGGLEPLSLLAKGKQRVMLGFVTTKTGELEKADNLKRMVDDASSFVDIDQLGIAPQCGFASTEEGNSLSDYEQWRKLELVVSVAESLWGGV
ncbi:MAG: 5-methyltetrahydropteroyltriglutamate--homocysteine S-methyltransferase [Albidovulum sp.]|nr:5-methyltetrahydropteroyltriglutamate--homocysteine S-methyltransferase [Albidovulum sp.]